MYVNSISFFQKPIQKKMSGKKNNFSNMKLCSNQKLPFVNSNIFFGRSKKEHESWGITFNKDKPNSINFKMFTFSNAKNVYIEILDNTNKTDTNNVNGKDILVTRNGNGEITKIEPSDNASRIIKLDKKANGVFEKHDIDAQNNQFYRLIIVKHDNVIEKVKDPYSKSQPHIMGWSKTKNPNSYTWNDANWMEGKDNRRITRKNGKLENLRIYELNIPTITKEGRFDNAKSFIKTIKDKNLANAIEIMPVENTYSKQWGYDGVDKFAINEKMGTSDDFKSLIDYAHSIGLNVIIDMVPNHMGTDGDMLKRTGPYEKGDGSFGAMLNYEGQDNRFVRDWMANAALNWALEYHADGIRFDMTKPDYMGSDFTLKQIVAELNEHAPEVFAIAEDGMGNREKITTPIHHIGNHTQEIDNIDRQVSKVEHYEGIERLDDIGFDSEWDFVFYHNLNRALINPEPRDIGNFDNAFKHSEKRVKYSSSHDEIGNLDGTSPIVKYATAKLALAYYVDGKDKAEIGQKAAHLTQSLLTIYANGELDKISDEDFYKKLQYSGIRKPLTKQDIKDVYKYSLAKSKLAMGVLYSSPGPKMYFQGMEDNKLDYFKFFRKLSSDENPTSQASKLKQQMDREKGYDTSYETCIKDSIQGNIKVKGEVKKMMEKMERYTYDLNKIVDENPALQKGKITGTTIHEDNMVLAHTLFDKNSGNEIISIKNFSDKSYSSYGIDFPAGKWVEIINSDDEKYAGSGQYTNTDRVFQMNHSGKHFIKMNSNSVIYFKKVN